MFTFPFPSMANILGYEEIIDRYYHLIVVVLLIIIAANQGLNLIKQSFWILAVMGTLTAMGYLLMVSQQQQQQPWTRK